MKIAFCGVWHVHAWEYLQAAKEYAEVAGVYESDTELRHSFCTQNGLREFNSFEELLNSDADSVIVTSATSRHAEYIIKLCEAGKNIFTEKVLALSVEDCEKIREAVEKSGVKFVISLFWKYDANIRTVKAIADSGELGRINYFRFRNCHNGSLCNAPFRRWLPPHFYNKEECGGGAMMDLGAHGMYLTDWFLGMPHSFQSLMGFCYKDAVEDNAVTVMGYENGAIAVNEASFVANCCPTALEIGGEHGYVRYRKGDGIFKASVSTEYKWQTVEPLEKLPKPIEQFLTGNILDGCGIEEAIRLTKMMCEAYSHADKDK